ncbi:ABC transporter substrate-binding protein [Verrucomicrobia bacterium LW23]|nr:ABC transporter substrate-binding protein [Verrucomicrobia bacterium LW23]
MNSAPNDKTFFEKLNHWYAEKGEAILNTIGFSLLGICFLIATWRIIARSEVASDPSLITIRMSHWQLEAGVRDGLDVVAREYEKICAARGQKVRVEQIPVPEQVYANWFITQLVGGTAPDLVEIGKGSSDERLARFFQPFGPYLQDANPYNAGTDLEGVPWRNTFTDGLSSAYKAELLEYYQLPFTVLTTRVFYNKPLYKEIRGDKPVPKNYDEFMELCRDVVDYAHKHNKPGLLPIAGSKYNGPMIMGRLFGSQTQMLTQKNNRGLHWTNVPEENIMAYFRGDWSTQSPEIVSGLQLMQSVIQYMQPGFIQLQRDDGTLNFVQKHSLMIASGAWDRTSLEQESPFPVDVFRIPLPSPSDPKYGRFTMGQIAEGTSTAVGFGLNRASPNIEVAVDFYRFLTSRRGSEIFAQYSGWLPAIIGAKIPAKLEPFRPDMNGYPQGTELGQGSESNRVWDNNFYLLAKTPNDYQPFSQTISPQLRDAFFEDMKLIARGRTRAISRMDVPLGALFVQALRTNGAPKVSEAYPRAVPTATYERMAETDRMIAAMQNGKIPGATLNGGRLRVAGAPEMVEQTFKVDPSFFAKGGFADEQVKLTLLEKVARPDFGFSAGASAQYIVHEHKLVVTNSPFRLYLLAALFDGTRDGQGAPASTPARKPTDSDDINLRKLSELMESQNALESAWYRYRRELKDVKR